MSTKIDTLDMFKTVAARVDKREFQHINRESVITGTISTDLPAVKSLIASLRWGDYL